MLKYLIIASILALILGVTIILQMAVLALFTDIKFEGFAGYITTQAELEKTVEVMQSKGLDIYRVSFRPSWQVPEENFKGYNTAYIDYLLINTSLSIIVDGNHLYPASEESAEDARTHWSEVRDRIFRTLERYPNNTRVAIELINEYASEDYDNRTQSLIDEIRVAGYSNTIVTNKLETAWHKFSDPLNNTYQGMHFFFNTWSTEGAMNQMNMAKANNITKILNTEVGASFWENTDFNQKNVGRLESFLTECQALGVVNCLWMNMDTINWQEYTQNDYHPKPSPLPPATPSTAAPIPTMPPAPSHTSTPTPTPPPITPEPTKPTSNSESGTFETNKDSTREFVIYSGSLLLFL